MISHRSVFCPLGFVIGILASATLGQERSSRQAAFDPDIALARALGSYRQGTESGYRRAIEALDGVLAASPQNRPALFLRTLARGELAEKYRDAAVGQPLGSPERAASNRQSRDTYALMKADLDRLVATITDADSIVRLLDAVACLKMAGPAPPPPAKAGETQPATDEPELRADPEQAVTLLADAAKLLNAYLHPPGGANDAPGGLNSARAQLFLGVAEFRHAGFLTKRAEPDGGARHKDLRPEAERALGRAEEVFSALLERLPSLLAATPDQLATWQAYTSFYAGLVHIEKANLSSHPQGALKDAVKDLRAARQYDRDPQGQSRTDVIAGVVDTLVGAASDEVGGKIGEVLKTREHESVAPYQDFRVDWRSGFLYDTNVPLLGGNTPPPRAIGKKQDFRFATGVALSYSGTLAALADKDDPELDRWQIGLSGRVSSGWNASIREFNEQDYGGSAAIQYRLIDQQNDGAKHGPVYLGIQYDYDQFQLGNKGFLRSNRVTPRLTIYTFDQRAITVLGFSYEDRNYLDPLYSQRFDRDGNYYSFNATQAVKLVDMTQFYSDLGIEAWGLANDPRAEDEPYLQYQRYLKPYIGLEVGRDSTQGSEFDANRVQLAAGIGVPLPFGLLFDFQGAWEWQNYNGLRGGSLVDFHRRGREDFIQRYSFGLERSFVVVPGNQADWSTLNMGRVVLTVRGDIAFTNDDSNVVDRLKSAVFSYDRAIYGLSFILSFN